MSIAEFIQADIFQKRLKDSECLVVYDPDQRYRDLCLDLATADTTVIDASASNIESREQAQIAFQKLSTRDVRGLIVYAPTAPPATDEQRQRDPFTIYTLCGKQFPASDGDEYQSLCLRAKPEHSTEIRRIFKDNPNPPFATIDAVGGGLNWPQLRSTLQVESSEDILLALLVPTDQQQSNLKTQAGWLPEAKDFLKAALGLKLKTRAKTQPPIGEELWRFILFSEFAIDLPQALPEALQAVPKATDAAENLVYALCDRLRNDDRYKTQYLERAATIEAELNLRLLCTHIEDLGHRDTFPFEERTFLRQAVQGLVNDDLDITRQLLTRHTSSVWQNQEGNQEQWSLVQCAVNLIVACEDCDRLLPEVSRTQDDLVDFYINTLRITDQRQREFEQSVGDIDDPDNLLGDVIDAGRKQYRRLLETVQPLFTRHLEKEGWPVPSRLTNANAFNRFVAPQLSDKGRRVAYLMIDALRYELGVELEKRLAEIGAVEIHAACAQLPTTTLVGMASLLPNAADELSLRIEGSKLIPKLGEDTVSNVTQRMKVLQKRYGDRFKEMTLRSFVDKKKLTIEATVDLLVLRSTEIDSQLENNPQDTLSLVPKTLKLIRAAIAKLRKQGFHEAVIVSDHGFFLNSQAEAGDVCQRPQGTWSYCAHDRMLFGDGSADANNLLLSTDKLGIRINVARAALPKTMAPYRAGHLYFHGGASLVEAIVPILTVRLDDAQLDSFEQFQVEMNYKNGRKRITTPLPRIEVSLGGNLFSQAQTCEILLEAQDSKGNVVGEPRPSEDVNPATRTITLNPSETKQILLRMEESFEGKFTIKALNPNTLTAYATLNLSTDYTI